MKAGRELDALVAEKVMGLRRFQRRWERGIHAGESTSWLDSDNIEIPGQLPSYSTNITAAWEVVEKLSEKLNIQISVRDGGVAIEVNAGSIDTLQYISGYPLPLAICIAALGALP